MIDPDFLNECIDIDAETGESFWRSRPRDHFKTNERQASWNSDLAGKSLGVITTRDGVQYRRLRVKGALRREHKFALAYPPEREATPAERR